MIKTVLPALLMACLLAFNVQAGQMADNEYFSLELPEGWEAASPGASENGEFSLTIVKESGDCLINISIMPFAGSAGDLIGQISKTMANSGIVMGEQRQAGAIYYRRFKKREQSGILYVGANGSEAAMTSIYGSAKLQREADKLLRGLKAKKDQALFPSFD